MIDLYWDELSNGILMEGEEIGTSNNSGTSNESEITGKPMVIRGKRVCLEQSIGIGIQMSKYAQALINMDHTERSVGQRLLNHLRLQIEEDHPDIRMGSVSLEAKQGKLWFQGTTNDGEELGISLYLESLSDEES